MLGYPPSPAVEVARPRPPLSPADKIPTSKEQEFATIHTLNTRLRSLLDRDKRENLDLEKKRNVSKEAFGRIKEDLDMLLWTYNQACADHRGHKETFASTEADAITADINNADKSAFVAYLKASKEDFLTQLRDMIAKKQQKLALLESKILDVKLVDNKSIEHITERTAHVIAKTDALKLKLVENARIQAGIQDVRAQKRIEAFHEMKWAERCAPYDGLDPSEYAALKETERIRSREAELDLRFRKIYDDTVEQMIEQSQKDRRTAVEKKRQSDAEKQNLEALTKDLRGKRVQLVNEIGAGEADLDKARKELQDAEAQLRELQQHKPTLMQTLAEIEEKHKKAEAERKTFAAKAELRDKHLAKLQARLKEKQEQAAKDKVVEDNALNDLKEKLQQKRQRVEEANIGLFPEISKYRGLVDVVEVKLTPNAKKQKRSTM